MESLALIARLIPEAAISWADPMGVSSAELVRGRIAFAVWWWLALCAAAALRSVLWGVVRMISKQYLIVSRSWRWRWMALAGWTLAVAVPLLSIGLLRRFGYALPGAEALALVSVVLAVAGEVGQAPQLWLDRQSGSVIWRGPDAQGRWFQRSWPADSLHGELPSELHSQLLDHLGSSETAAWWVAAVQRKAKPRPASSAPSG